MEWIIENWFLVVALVAVLAICFVATFKWLGKPTAEQIAQYQAVVVICCD